MRCVSQFIGYSYDVIGLEMWPPKDAPYELGHSCVSALDIHLLHLYTESPASLVQGSY